MLYTWHVNTRSLISVAVAGSKMGSNPMTQFVVEHVGTEYCIKLGLKDVSICLLL